MKNLYKIEDELYIISNTENVDENCWLITNGKLVQVSYLLSNEVAKGNKVILTTNKLLIKDGVQAIDDEVLEWFINNSNCEEIEVVDVRSLGVYGSYYPYKIIIPKEDTKQETLEEAAKRCFEEMKILNPRGSIKEFIRMAVNFGAKWQQEQEQNNENSWFNEYQKLEDYIIKRIADKFLEATPEKYNTASEATIALIENNWQQERMYSEDDMIMFADFFHNYKELLKKEKWEILEMSKEDVFKKWKQI